MLTESLRILRAKKHYRLIVCKGVITGDDIDTGKRDVLGQALANAPERIRIVAKVDLQIHNNLLPIETIETAIKREIQPILNILREYLHYFLFTINLKSKQEGNHE